MKIGIGLGIPHNVFAGGGFTPASLFSDGSDGAWFEPSPDTCFTDLALTTPAVVGDPVRGMLDLSGNGNHATGQPVAGANPILSVMGGYYYLDFTSTQRELDIPAHVSGSENHTICYVANSGNGTSQPVFGHGSSGGAYQDRSFTTFISMLTTGTFSTVPVANNTKGVTTNIVYDGRANPSIWYDGLSRVVTNNDAARLLSTATNPAKMGRAINVGYGNVHVYGLVSLDKAVTADEQVSLEAYLATRSGVPVTYDIILMAGQSNMAGRAPYDSGTVHPDYTLQWTQAGALADLTGNALDHPGMTATNMGVDISFAEDYRAANPLSNLVFIPEASGSTGFSDNNWNQGDVEYTAAVAATNAAIAAIPNSRIVAIMWLQGEQDANDSRTEAQYAGDLDAMIAAMRTDITGATNVPFVAGQIPNISGTFFPTQAEIRAAITDLPNRVLNTAVTTNTGLTKLGDGLHYDAASLRVMGSRMFTALNSLL